jgi:di/tricarboxylate transporter
VLDRPGLSRALDQAYAGAGRVLIEAVVAPGGSLPGCAVNDAGFRVRLNAALVAIGRHDQALGGALGERRLAAGDLLLLETLPDYLPTLRGSPDLHVLTVAEPSRRPRAWLAPLVLLLVIAALGTGALDLVRLAAGDLLLLAGGALRPAEAARALQPGLLGSILGALVLGLALERSGAAGAVAGTVLGWTGESPRLALIGIYLATIVATELLTNNAAAALILPFALQAAERLDCAPLPFAVAVMMAASAAFITPIGYQTNLLVWAPGGYRWSDYLRMGLPLTALTAATAIIAIEWAFPY